MWVARWRNATGNICITRSTRRTWILPYQKAWKLRITELIMLTFFLSWSNFSSRLIPVTQPEDIDPNLDLDNSWSYFEYQVRTLKAGCWNTKKGDDKETSPGRPPLCVFPWKTKAVKLIKGEAVLTCRFLMLILTGEFTAGLEFSAFFAVKNWVFQIILCLLCLVKVWIWLFY